MLGESLGSCDAWVVGPSDPSAAAATGAGFGGGALRAAQQQGGGAGPGPAYPLLQGALLAEFEQGLRAAVERAVAAANAQLSPAGGAPPPLTGTVSGPEGGAGAGHVTVSLACQPERRAWLGMVDVAVGVLGAEAGSVAGLTPVVVNMRAPRGASLAVCRRVCLGRAVLRAATLRHAAAALGGDGSDGAGLAQLLAAPGVWKL